MQTVRAGAIGRRRVLGGGAVAAAVWVSPSVIGLDRVAAAQGSCGFAPVQVDWSDHSDTFPTMVTANDGTVVTIQALDPSGVANTNLLGRVFPATLSGRDEPIIMAMSGASNGQFTELVFTFSTPVHLCSELIDVDRAQNGWEDTMEMFGTLNGVAVDLTASDVVTGPTNTFVGTNTLVGTGPAAQAATDGNATFNYPSPIDSFTLRHRDNSTFTEAQYIGMHDLRWC